MPRGDLAFLETKARAIRKTVLRMVTRAGSGHIGGSLSCIEIVCALYYRVLRHRPRTPRWSRRDRFILSKGHAAPTLYAVLADLGYFPRRLLGTLREFGSPLQGHPSSRRLPGIEVSTGSLGQGLSVANGIALAGRLDRLDYRVYALLGDGELNEGETWEAVQSAAHFHLNTVTAIVDNNELQLDGPISEIKDTHPIPEKFRSFGWNTLAIDGHDFEQILDALAMARLERARPTAIIARTIKGCGVPFMENRCEYHGMAPSEEELKWALLALE